MWTPNPAVWTKDAGAKQVLAKAVRKGHFPNGVLVEGSQQPTKGAGSCCMRRRTVDGPHEVGDARGGTRRICLRVDAAPILNVMKRGLPSGTTHVSSERAKGGPHMLYAGLDLTGKRLDVHLLEESGATKEVTAVSPDADALRTLASSTARHGEPVRAAIESMNGARFVHDILELAGWDVEIADAQKVKGLAPLACKTYRIDALGAGRAGPQGPGVRDLVANARRPSRAGAGPVPPAPSPAPHRSQEPDPRHADRLRPPLPRVRPVWDFRPGAPGAPGHPRAVGGVDGGQLGP